MAKKKEEEITKSETIELALAAIEKAHGKGAVMFGNQDSIPGVEFRLSGCLGLDRALGGGYGKGRIIEIYGPESSGKTTLALHAIATAQARGETAAFIDIEHAFDPNYATALGVKMKELLISQPDTGEQALEICETLIRTGAVNILALDSVAALVPRAEIEGEMGDSHMGLQARLMSQAMRKLNGIVYTTDCTMIFINQIRMKIGILFGNPEVTSGGNALKFYASQRLDVRRIKGLKEGTEVVANRTRVKVVKNKIAAPFKQTEFNIVYGKGIDVHEDLLAQATEARIIEEKAHRYSYGDIKLGYGKPKATQYLKDNPELYDKLYKELINR